MSESNYLTDPGVFRDCHWIAQIPFEQVNTDLKSRQMIFNLTTFILPEQNMNINEIHYQGANLHLPSGVRDSDKDLSFEYLLDENLMSYKFLYDWAALFSQEGGAGSSTVINGVLAEGIVPVTVILLTPFKKPLLTLKFHDAWISRIGELNLSYQSEDNPILHTFDLKYSWMEMIDERDNTY